jgi:hypothetical protein
LEGRYPNLLLIPYFLAGSAALAASTLAASGGLPAQPSWLFSGLAHLLNGWRGLLLDFRRSRSGSRLGFRRLHFGGFGASALTVAAAQQALTSAAAGLTSAA